MFVDVQGDKYLAKIVKTFPPRALASSPVGGSSSKPVIEYHPLATKLDLDMDEVNESDDPMKYFYSVRLIVDGSMEGGEQFEGSVMEVQADKIRWVWVIELIPDDSRDRINFSRAMLKRFIRDCVLRDPAVYSPWMVKASVAARYGISTEMPEEVRERIAQYKENQMVKRKREREERLGITHEEPEEEPPKTKKQRQAEEKVKVEEEELKKRKPLKYPADGE